MWIIIRIFVETKETKKNNYMQRSKLKGVAITDDQYNAFKKRALNHSIVRKVTALSSLTLIDDKYIGYAGVNFEMTPDAFKALIKILGLSNGFVETISKNLGENVTAKLLSMMKTALGATEDKNKVCLLIDQKSSKIVGFTKSASTVLSNNAFFSLFEETMNNHSGMNIKNMGITEAGNIELSVTNDKWEFNVGGLNDEYFKSGLVFINTPNSTIVNPFNERLVCTNGLISPEKGMSMILKNTDANSVSGFFDTVRNLKGVANFEIEFKNRIIRMMATQASYAEVLSVRKTVEYSVANMKDPDVRDTVETFIPTMYIKQAFMEQKMDLDIVDSSSYAKIRTHLNVWELVNKLTDLSSHPVQYGLTLLSGNSSIFELQRNAGKLAFKKQYDLECAVKQIF